MHWTAPSSKFLDVYYHMTKTAGQLPDDVRWYRMKLCSKNVSSSNRFTPFYSFVHCCVGVVPIMFWYLRCIHNFCTYKINHTVSIYNAKYDVVFFCIICNISFKKYPLIVFTKYPIPFFLLPYMFLGILFPLRTNHLRMMWPRSLHFGTPLKMGNILNLHKE